MRRIRFLFWGLLAVSVGLAQEFKPLDPADKEVNTMVSEVPIPNWKIYLTAFGMFYFGAAAILEVLLRRSWAQPDIVKSSGEHVTP